MPFQRFFALRFLHLISNGLIGVNVKSLMWIMVEFGINFCVIYLVKAHNNLISSDPMKFEN